MSEQQTPYRYAIKQPQHQADVSPRLFNLGHHTLEILEEQGILLVDHDQQKESMQLEKEESYRLLIVLQEVFQGKMPSS